MQIAVIDIGATTIHLQRASLSRFGDILDVWKAERVVHLGSGLSGRGSINGDRFRQGLACLSDLAAYARDGRPDAFVTVATNVLREAANADRFVKEARERAAVRINILSEEEEARLAYLGATTLPRVGGRRVGVVDIGGSSIVAAVGAGTEALFTANLPLGALRLSEQLETAGVNRRDWLALIKKRVHERADSAVRRIAELDPEVIVFNSDTARAVRELVMRDTFQPGRLGRIDETSMMLAVDEVMRAGDRKLGAMGINPERIGVIRAAMCTMLSLMEALRVDRVEVSDRGLRDGVILQEYRRIRVSESSGVHRRPSGLWKWMVERAS